MLTDTALCPWAYFECPSKIQLWMTGQIRRRRRVWRRKHIPFRVESNPYWADYAKGPELEHAFDMTLAWRMHMFRCVRLAYNEPFRLALCMGMHDGLGSSDEEAQQNAKGA